MQVWAFVGTVVIISWYLTVLAVTKPFVPAKVWKRPVKVLMLSISMLASLVNMLWFFVEDRGVDGGGLLAAANALSYLLFALCVALVVMFLVEFWRMILAGARSDQDVKRRATMSECWRQKCALAVSDCSPAAAKLPCVDRTPATPAIERVDKL